MCAHTTAVQSDVVLVVACSRIGSPEAVGSLYVVSAPYKTNRLHPLKKLGAKIGPAIAKEDKAMHV